MMTTLILLASFPDKARVRFRRKNVNGHNRCRSAAQGDGDDSDVEGQRRVAHFTNDHAKMISTRLHNCTRCIGVDAAKVPRLEDLCKSSCSSSFSGVARGR